jgi:uncharacterized protein (DUF302 family)
MALTIMISSLKKTLPLPFDQVLERVTAALKTEGFGVLTEIDVRETLKKKLDVEFRRYRILGACNPPLAYRALSAELDVGVMMPCNVIVYETEPGQTAVTMVDPMQALAGQHPELTPIAAEVGTKLARVLQQLG